MNFFVTVVRREFVRLRDGATKCLNCGGGKTALAAALVFLSGISSAFAVIPVENVDVTELVRYDGDVFIHSVGNRGDQRGQTVGMMERNTVDVASVLREIDLDNGLYKFTIPQGCSISTISTGYNHLSEIVMTDRTNAGVRKDVADSFLSRIDFEFKGEWNDGEISKNVGAIRALIYCIADNPVGLRLLQRILNGLGNYKINFEIDAQGKEFVFNSTPATVNVKVPVIEFDGVSAKRNDVGSFGIALDLFDDGKREELVLSKHDRPFYIGLVHELIHMMHYLEGQKVGDRGLDSISDAFGGETLWGETDDLHTIWGVFSVSGKPVHYDNVSELTFRIADNIPVRVFYDTYGEFNSCNLSVYVDSEDKKRGILRSITVTDENGDDKEVNVYERLKEVLNQVKVNCVTLCELKRDNP